MKKNLQVVKYFALIVLFSMIAVTTWASLEKGVTAGFEFLFSERWGWATLADAYFGFLTFTLWVFYKEQKILPRFLWLVGILFFGNIAMASYILWELYRLPKEATMDQFLIQRR